MYIDSKKVQEVMGKKHAVLESFQNPVDLCLIPLLICFYLTGMHFIRHHVSEGAQGSAHGPQLLLWS